MRFYIASTITNYERVRQLSEKFIIEIKNNFYWYTVTEEPIPEASSDN